MFYKWRRLSKLNVKFLFQLNLHRWNASLTRIAIGPSNRFLIYFTTMVRTARFITNYTEIQPTKVGATTSIISLNDTLFRYIRAMAPAQRVW